MGEVHPRYGSELHLPAIGILSCNQQVVTWWFFRGRTWTQAEQLPAGKRCLEMTVSTKQWAGVKSGQETLEETRNLHLTLWRGWMSNSSTVGHEPGTSRGMGCCPGAIFQRRCLCASPPSEWNSSLCNQDSISITLPEIQSRYCKSTKC